MARRKRARNLGLPPAEHARNARADGLAAQSAADEAVRSMEERDCRKAFADLTHGHRLLGAAMANAEAAGKSIKEVSDGDIRIGAADAAYKRRCARK